MLHAQRIPFLAVVVSFALGVPALPAQRASAKLTVGDREVALDYGVVPRGKHTLAELPPGQEWPAGDEGTLLVTKGILRTAYGPAWRLGMNEASVLRTQVPLLAGESILVAPGAYRVSLHRKTEKEVLLVLSGAGLALGANTDLGLPGTLEESKLVADKLAIEWNPPSAKNKKDLELATELVARYGPHEVRVPLRAIVPRAAKLAGYQLDVFAYDAKWLAERIEKKQATPWLALRPATAKKDKEAFSLVVTGETGSLTPWMTAPEELFGFGNVVPPNATAKTEGSVQSAKAGATKPRLEADKCERSSKGEFTFRLAFGEVLATATLADASAKRPAR